MRSTGIVRGVDIAGRVILPPDICAGLGVKRGEDSLEIFIDGNAVVLKKYEPGCIFCGSMDELAVFQDVKICRSCREKIGAIEPPNA